jgi:hypothetical protein
MNKTNFGIAGAALLFTACGPLNIPLDLESKSATLNIDEAVAEAEARICEDNASENCAILMALDATDGTSETVPTLPTSIPKTVDPDGEEGAAEPLDVEQWLADSGIMDSIRAKQAIGADLSDRLAASQNQIQDVSFETVVFNWQENTLSFTTMELDFYVGEEVDADEEGNYDAEALIADGSLTKAGTIAAQAAGGTGESEVTFADGGKDQLASAVKTLKFVVGVAIPDGAEITLNEDDAGNWVKPSGMATITLKTTLNFTVNPQTTATDAAAAETTDGESASEEESNEEDANGDGA